VIEVIGLRKRFGEKPAVDGISFCVRPGEILGFLGPNGAGKTTTLRMLTGFLPPDQGQVSLCGYDLSRKPLEAKRCFGYLPEGCPLYGEMSCRELLEFIAKVRGLRGEDKRRAIASAVEQLELHSVLDCPIERLSKGFKRRVGLAQAILHRPQALILDEPTDGLDPLQRAQVLALLKSYAKSCAILLSTHLLEEVEAICHRVVILGAGRILQAGILSEIAQAGGLKAIFFRLFQQ
jgi:ABC-2 type transport system ATP-binding protein